MWSRDPHYNQLPVTDRVDILIKNQNEHHRKITFPHASHQDIKLYFVFPDTVKSYYYDNM